MSQSTIGQRISEGMKAAKARRAAMPRDLARELKVEQAAKQRIAAIGVRLLEQVDALEKKSMTQDQRIIRLEGIIANTVVSLKNLIDIYGFQSEEEIRAMLVKHRQWIITQCEELRKEQDNV